MPKPFAWPPEPHRTVREDDPPLEPGETELANEDNEADIPSD